MALRNFPYTDEFDMDKDGGLQIAFGLTNYGDGNYEMIHEPEYGEIKVVMK